MAFFSGGHACELHEDAATDAFSSQFAALLAWSGRRPLMSPVVRLGSKKRGEVRILLFR